MAGKAFSKLTGVALAKKGVAMATCIRCNRPSGFFSKLVLDPETNRCPSCEQSIKLIKKFKAGILPNVDPSAPCAKFHRGDPTVEVMAKFADGWDRPRVEAWLLQSKNPGSELLLDSDEFCHLKTEATHEKKGEGQLIATSKRLLFLCEKNCIEISWKRLMRISIIWPELKTGWFGIPVEEPDPDPGILYLELTTKTGHGKYRVPNARLTKALFMVLVRLSKMIRPRNSMSRHIPQDVRQTVWLRDDGKCVECDSESELQFDHIIPHSKGGSNTVENIRILCRVCNSKKRARI